jgi:hypothetical protein
MIEEPLFDQLKITYVDLEELEFYPELDKYKDTVFKINVSYSMAVSRTEDVSEEDNNMECEVLDITVDITIHEHFTNEPLAHVSATTTFESKLLTLNDVNENFFFRLMETSIEHCSAWMARSCVNTPLEPHVIQHMPPENFGPNVKENLSDIWK